MPKMTERSWWVDSGKVLVGHVGVTFGHVIEELWWVKSWVPPVEVCFWVHLQRKLFIRSSTSQDIVWKAFLAWDSLARLGAFKKIPINSAPFCFSNHVFLVLQKIKLTIIPEPTNCKYFTKTFNWKSQTKKDIILLMKRCIYNLCEFLGKSSRRCRGAMKNLSPEHIFLILENLMIFSWKHFLDLKPPKIWKTFLIFFDISSKYD